MSPTASAGATRWPRFGVHGLGIAAAIAAPLVLAEWRPAVVGMSYGVSFLPFELLGLTGGLAIALVGVAELRRRRGAGLEGWLGVVVPCLLALAWLTLTSEYAQRRFDYDCYEYAGRALRAGESPYRVGLIYLYPPLTAQAFAAAHGAVSTLAGWLGGSVERDAVWDRVFYLYQCAQILLALGAYFLLMRLSRTLGWNAWWLPVAIGALLLFANPVFRTLRHGQINLWVLDLALLALLLARSRPALAGSALALAAHLKLYPLLLLLPLALCGRWRALGWCVAVGGGLVLVGSSGGTDWTLWSEYAALLRGGFPGEVAFRNTSLHGVAHNTARLVLGTDGSGAAVRWVVRLGTLAFAGWALWRLALRERLARSDALRVADPHGQRRLALHGADALAFALLASPSVWEHHYVLALPLALVAWAGRGADRPGWLGAGLFLALAMPTFDLFPLGYHRLAGLLVLLAISRPGAGEGGWSVAAEGDSGSASTAGVSPSPASR